MDTTVELPFLVHLTIANWFLLDGKVRCRKEDLSENAKGTLACVVAELAYIQASVHPS